MLVVKYYIYIYMKEELFKFILIRIQKCIKTHHMDIFLFQLKFLYDIKKFQISLGL
jgi:hypothetical protein